MKLNKFTAFLIILGLMFSLTNCNILRFNDPEGKAKKQLEKENKRLEKAYRADVKNHYKMQSKESRKRMNKNLNKAIKDIKHKKGKSRWKCS
jgi:hypothetical protein